MRKQLDEALCRDFPLTFRDRHGDIRSSCMPWGFDVSDGWEPLIRKACEKIEPRIQQLIDEGKENEFVQYKASQCKEKFGSLRFYFTFCDDIIDAAIEEAENASEHTCEHCGEDGKTRDDGWLITLCDECHIERITSKASSNTFYGILAHLQGRRENAFDEIGKDKKISFSGDQKTPSDEALKQYCDFMDAEIQQLKVWFKEKESG